MLSFNTPLVFSILVAFYLFCIITSCVSCCYVLLVLLFLFVRINNIKTWIFSSFLSMTAFSGISVAGYLI
jgi:hypothetical protein